jgi:hypothetical protein
MKALALARVSTHEAHAEASARYELRDPLNGRDLSVSRGARNARRGRERKLGRLLARDLACAWPGGVCAVVLTRVSPRPFDAHKLKAIFEAVRDGMAQQWGVDDGDDAVVWLYDGRKGPDARVEARLWWLSELT